MANSKSFSSPYEIPSIAQENKYLGIFFLFYHEIVYCVYSLKLPHRGDSNEYTNIQLLCRKMIKKSVKYNYLLPNPAPWLTLSVSNYACLEQFLWSQRCLSHWSSSEVKRSSSSFVDKYGKDIKCSNKCYYSSIPTKCNTGIQVWSWNIFYGHSLPSLVLRRAVVSFWRKNVHNTG